MRAWLLVLPLLCACGSAGGPGPGTSCPAAGYPCGPYGYGRGAVIADLTVIGRRDEDKNGTATNDPVREIHFHDYHGQAGLSALVVLIGAQTCVPCQNEQPSLVELYKQYQPKVAFLEAIVEGAAGRPADQSVIDNWATVYALPFDITHDPTQALAPYYPAGSFPSAMAMRTSDMSIVYSVVGPADGLAAVLEQIAK
jgi:thiol-disulfide isomerase/thioredoxin